MNINNNIDRAAYALAKENKENITKLQNPNLNLSIGSPIVTNYGGLTWEATTRSTYAQDTTNKLNSTASARFTNTTPGQSAIVTLVNQTSIVFDNIGNIYLSIFNNGASRVQADLNLQFYKTSSDGTGYKIEKFGAEIHPGWNTYIYKLSDKVVLAGSPTTANTFTCFRIVIISSSAVDLSVDVPMVASITTPKCVIQIDDGKIDTRDNALPILDKYGVKATWFVTKSWVGTTGYLDVPSLIDLQSLGHDIGNHSLTHADPTSMTYAQSLTEFGGMQSWMNANGLYSASDHIAYPNGVATANGVQACVDSGIKTGYFIWNSLYELYPFANKNRLKRISIDYTKNKATIKGIIDDAYSYGGTVFLLFHYVVSDTPNASGEISIADFDEYIAYVQSKNIEMATVSEWYKSV